MVALTITGKQLVSLCEEDEDTGIYYPKNMIIQDHPVDCRLSNIDSIEFDGKRVYFEAGDFEYEIALTEELRVLIYKEINSLEELNSTQVRTGVNAFELKLGQTVIKHEVMSEDTKHTVTKKLLYAWQNDTWYEDAVFDIIADPS
jgi:hypothetical protein